MHRCQLCHVLSPPRASRLIHVIERVVVDGWTGLPRREIAQELTVCPSCKRGLSNGVPLSHLVRARPIEPVKQFAPIRPDNNGRPRQPQQQPQQQVADSVDSAPPAISRVDF